MSEMKYETARAIEPAAGGGMERQDSGRGTEKQGRTHRVGTITCGLLFVLYGVLFLLHMVIPDLNYRVIFELWPLFLISLGLEILASCTRKNREEKKIIYDFPAVLLIMLLVLFVIIMAAADYGMNVTREWSAAHFFDYSSSYFERYSAQEQDGQSRIRGTVCLAENNAGLQTVNAERETTITVTGSIDREEGGVRLLYQTGDGAEILIAEGDGSFDKTVTIPAGEGKLCFAGYDKKAVCDFDIKVVWGEGVLLEQESMESISEMTAELPEIVEAPEAEIVPEIGEISGMEIPIVDNWPESVRCDSEGMYAGLCEFPLVMEEPMNLKLSCVTENGSLDLWIEDAAGNKYFDKKDIQTDDYNITVDKAGTYTVFFHAEYYYGSFEITPVE